MTEELARIAQQARQARDAQQAANAAQAEAERQARAAEEARQHAEAEEARRRAMERTCEGTREDVAARAQGELTAALGAARGARVRVRIIVETIE